MWADDYDDRDERDAPFFAITCGCGYEMRNDEECPVCGNGTVSYSGADAARWNRYVDRERR